jgi:hypothetical protein
MKAFGLFVLALAFASSASALNLKEKKQFNDWQAYLKDPAQSYVGTVKTKCGYEIPVTIDEKFTTPFMADNANAASYCDATRSTISGMCDDATAKPMIVKTKKKIDSYYVKKYEATLALKGGTLTFTVGLGASNLDEKVKTYLENNLQ